MIFTSIQIGFVDVKANTQMNMKVGQASAIPLSLKAQNGAMLKALATHFIVPKKFTKS